MDEHVHHWLLSDPVYKYENATSGNLYEYTTWTCTSCTEVREHELLIPPETDHDFAQFNQYDD